MAQAQMSRQEQAQTWGQASEGPVYPYLVFKELGGFLLALLPTHKSEATHSCWVRQAAGVGAEAPQWCGYNTIVQSLVSTVQKKWVQILLNF